LHIECRIQYGVLAVAKPNLSSKTSLCFQRSKIKNFSLTGVGTGKERTLKALTISKDKPELPAGYASIKLDASGSHEDEASFSAPELTHDSKGRRWLVYAEGPREKAHLRLTPLGIDLQPLGRTFPITSDEVFGSEARLVALPDGKFVVVYIREKEGKSELVSEHLSCEIMKK